MTPPVLLIIFNRPETTKKVFEAIRKAKPRQLFIVADGPRKNNQHDAEFCPQARAVVETIDWDCEVHKDFRDVNMGCKYGTNRAITWFFEHVESGIILEDDCLPNESFFGFCDEMLARYKDDEHVGVISGNNFIQRRGVNMDFPNDEYFFVAPVYTWGWATWRRAWAKQELEMETWTELKKNRFLKTLFKNKNVVGFYSHVFDHSQSGRARTWDAPWLFTCLKYGMLCIVPPRNLVSNIGVVGTTSREESVLQNLSVDDISLSTLKHPPHVTRNMVMEDTLLNVTNADKPSTRRDTVEILKKLKLDSLVRFIYRRLHLRF